MDKIYASSQQKEFIANLIYRKKNYTNYLKKIWSDTPRNNRQHSDTRCDYTQIILAERFSGLTSSQANYIIKAWQGEKGYKVLIARNIIVENIIN